MGAAEGYCQIQQDGNGDMYESRGMHMVFESEQKEDKTGGYEE